MLKAKSSNPRGPAKTVIRRPWIENGACVGIKLDGQPYRYIRTGFYRSERTGNVTEVDYYSTQCLDCQAPLEFFEPSGNQDHFWPARRCKDCSAKSRQQDDEADVPLAPVVTLSRYRIGDRVRHGIFGEGVVTDLIKPLAEEGAPADRRPFLEVQFSVGKRKLVEAFVERA